MKLKNYILENGEILIKKEGGFVDVNDLKNLKHIVQNYKEFLSAYRKIFKKNQNKQFYFQYYINEDYLLVGTSKFDSNKKINLEIIYKFTNEHDYKDMLDLLPMIKTDNEWFSYGILYENNLTNHIPIAVMNVILTYRNILRRGEKPFSKFVKYTGADKKKKRLLIAPHPEIKESLRDLNKILTATYDQRNIDFQVGFKKGKSVKINAEMHKNNKYIVKADIKDFFLSCKKELVEKYIEFMFHDIAKDIKNYLLDIIIDPETNSLFLGNPISPTLANVIISKPVKYLKNMMNKHGIMLSVYADDLTFSSNKRISKKFIIDSFNNAFKEYNLDNYFKLNKKKTIARSNSRRRITGVSINQFDQCTIKRSWYKSIRAKIHYLSQGKVQCDLNKLRGQLSYALYIDESGKIANYLIKFKDTVKKYKLIGKNQMLKLGIIEDEL